jgi:hypothetical protein
MWPYVRKYANYITEKITSYRVMAFDFCKVKRGRDDGLLRTMPTDSVRVVIFTSKGETSYLCAVVENAASATKSSRRVGRLQGVHGRTDKRRDQQLLYTALS